MDKVIPTSACWCNLDLDDKDEILWRMRKLNAERAAEEGRGT